MGGWEEEETWEGGSVEEFTLAWVPYSKSRLITKTEVSLFTPIRGQMALISMF